MRPEGQRLERTVLGDHTSAETESGTIRSFEHLFVRVELEYGHDRSKDLKFSSNKPSQDEI